MREHFTSKAEGSHKSALRNQNKTAQITEKKLLDLFKQKTNNILRPCQLGTIFRFN